MKQTPIMVINFVDISTTHNSAVLSVLKTFLTSPPSWVDTFPSRTNQNKMFTIRVIQGKEENHSLSQRGSTRQRRPLAILEPSVMMLLPLCLNKETTPPFWTVHVTLAIFVYFELAPSSVRLPKLECHYCY
ncbi:hypothetical protein TNCV_1678041 [Trichonephila clavipes]|nr:hypothetical protein TNCV_1678041 [Trichonephila clavipes]